MAAEWFLSQAGREKIGPLTPQQLRQMAAAGQIGPADNVWKQGMPKWIPASQVRGLLNDATPASSPPVAVAPQQTSWPAAQQSSAVAAAPAFAFDEEEGPAAYTPAEPWFYGFVAGYTKVFMWLGIVVYTLGFLLMAGGYALPLLFYRASSGADGRGMGFAVVIALFGLVFGVLLFGLAILGVLFLAALFLMAVDAGRNLRAIRYQSKR